MLKKYSKGHKIELALKAITHEVTDVGILQEIDTQRTTWKTYIGDNKGDLTILRKNICAMIQAFCKRSLSTYEIRNNVRVEKNEVTTQFYIVQKQGKFVKPSSQDMRKRGKNIISQTIQVTVIIDGQEMEQQDLRCIINR